MTTEHNSIERQILIKAPLEKIWVALTDTSLFGQWFGATFQSAFVAGQTSKARNTTKGYEMDMEFFVRDIQPMTYFAYAWHPFPIDPAIDYSKEDPTLVEFHLEQTSDGILVRVKESGFNRITASRRAKAFEMHTGGWEAQLRNIEAFVGNT